MFVKRELTAWSLRRQGTLLWGLSAGTVITNWEKKEPNNFARASRYSQVAGLLLLFHKKKKPKNYFLLVCLFVYRRCLENEKKKFGKNKRDVIKSVRVLVLTIFQSGQDGNKAKMFKLERVCCKGSEFWREFEFFDSPPDGCDLTSINQSINQSINFI